MIEVSSLAKSFSGTPAVADVSFTAGDGEVTGLLGPNGAGKTTTLRILSTILRADAGTANVDGLDCAKHATDVRRRLGVVTAGAGLYPRLSAREHVFYYGRLHGLSESLLEARCTKLADELQMHDIIDRRVAGFSQGEKLKVNIARALVHDPRNVLLDEPTNGLDVIATRAMRGIIKSFRDQGRCVVVSTHVMQEVAALCDRIVIIAKGRVVADGSGDALLARTSAASLEDAFVSLVGGPT
ncbi:MAG: ATP-binding cassette domain-containing protein [Myxococcota bacterium]